MVHGYNRIWNIGTCSKNLMQNQTNQRSLLIGSGFGEKERKFLLLVSVFSQGNLRLFTNSISSNFSKKISKCFVVLSGKDNYFLNFDHFKRLRGLKDFQLIGKLLR